MKSPEHSTCTPGQMPYRHLSIQPEEFWTRNRLTATEALIVQRVTRHRFANQREDLRTAGEYIDRMAYWYFDAQGDERVVPAHWPNRRAWVIEPARYIAANRLPEHEAAIIHLVCDCSCRAHLATAQVVLADCIERDYGAAEIDPLAALNLRDVLYLAKTRLSEYLAVLLRHEGSADVERIDRLVRRLQIEWRRC